MVTWETITIGEIADFQGGSQPPLTTFSSQRKFGYLRLIQIRDYKTDKYQTFIPTHLAKRFCSANDIMIGRYGPPIFQILRGLSGAYNVALIKAIPKNVDKEFLYYTLTRKDLFDFIELLSRRSSGQTGVDLVNLRAFEILLPSLPEQRAIAAALSDVDGYISALERLIAKKRNIKKGAMQELLTGKRRLPGFEGEWVKRSVDYYGTFTSGNGFPRVYQGEKSGDYPFYKVSDFNNAGNEYTMCHANHYISLSVALTLNCNVIPDGSIVFAKIGVAIFRERKRQNQGDCCIDNNMMAFTTNSEGNSKYIMYLFQTIKFGDLVTATALPSLSGKQVGAIIKTFPPTKAEQTAIAAVLSDMDAEIDALTAKLAKVRNIKQGMMHELLTGRIRLISEEAEPAPVAKPTAKVIELPKREPQPVTARTGGHNQQFDDAVMIAGIVDALYSDKYPLGRKKVQKCLYLLRRHQDKSTAAFKKKAAGPYADEVRYKGGEPIARSAKYIVTTSTKGKGTTFARGSNITQALGYIQSWGRQADIKWLADKLKYMKVDDLELLATVDMAICDLEEAGTPVSVVSIKRLIATNAEWKAKLKKQPFSDGNIARAIKELETLL